MSRLLEAAQNKPPELVQAEESLKSIASERERAFRVRGELNAELQEARKILEAAEVNAGDAEARARIDGNKADGKVLEAARKNLVGSRETVERLEGTQRGLKRTLDELKTQAVEAIQALDHGEDIFRQALLDAFSRDLEEAAKALDPIFREGFALSERLSFLRTILDVSLLHPQTRRNLLPADLPSLHGESRTPTSESADQLREIIRGLQQTRRLLDIDDDGSETEDQAEDVEPLPAA